MKHASASGMGRVCTAKAGITIPTVRRVIDAAAVRALLALSAAFAAARRRAMA
jgi:hypothetical protein